LKPTFDCRKLDFATFLTVTDWLDLDAVAYDVAPNFYPAAADKLPK